MKLSDRSLKARWVELLPLLVPTSVVLLGSCFRSTIDLGSVTLAGFCSAEPNAQLLAARIVWAACALLMAGGCIGCAVACLMILCGSGALRRAVTCHEVEFVVGLESIGLCALAVFLTATTQDQAYIPAAKDHLAAVLDGQLGPLAMYGNYAVIVLMFLLMVASASAVWMPEDEDFWIRAEVRADLMAERLAESMQHTRHVLYAGAILLSATALQIRALYNWVAVAGNVPGIAQIGNAATFGFALFFALFLAAVYLPAALLLYHRAAMLVRGLDNVPVKDRRAWLDDRELGASPIAQLLAIIAPIVASGPAQSLVGALADVGRSVGTG